MNDTEALLKKLKQINKKTSCEKIGREIGVSGQTVYRWLTGKNAPSGLALASIERYVSEQ